MATKKESKTIEFNLQPTRSEIAGYLIEQVRSEIKKRKAAVQKKRHAELRGLRGKTLTQEEIDEIPGVKAIFELAKSIVTDDRIMVTGAFGADETRRVTFTVFSHRDGDIGFSHGSRTFSADLNIPPEELSAFWKEQYELDREYTRLTHLHEKYAWMDMTKYLVAHAIEKSDGNTFRVTLADMVDELVNKGE